MIVLAGDIGGTNARLAIVQIEAHGLSVQHEAKYPSREFPGLGPIVRDFLSTTHALADRACFGCAGPVVDQRCATSNLSWVIDARELARETGIMYTRLINDFAAVGYGLERLGAKDVVTLQAGQPQPKAPIGLIGAGTGLGHGFLLWDGAGYRVHPSEAGHTAFAARDSLEVGLMEFLKQEFGRVSWERVVSGPGLVNVYRYLAASGYAPEAPAVHAEMEREDPGAVVTKHALAGSDILCGKALEVFVSCYGAQAGHLGLTILATGGVYVAGGIAPRIIDKLKEGAFLASFKSQGRFSEFTAAIPLHIVMNSDVGLLGAASAGFRGV